MKAQPAVLDREGLRTAAREWVARSCAAQGIPVKVSDPATIRKVAAIILEARAMRARESSLGADEPQSSGATSFLVWRVAYVTRGSSLQTHCSAAFLS